MFSDWVSGTHGAEDELDLLLCSRARPGDGLSQSGPWQTKKKQKEVVNSRSRDPRSEILRTLDLSRPMTLK